MIASDTVREIRRLAGQALDARRFRPECVVRLLQAGAFQRTRGSGVRFHLARKWGGGTAIAVTMRDLRCSMVNLDPDTAESAPEVMKAIVRANQNYAGVYGTVTRAGRIAVGQGVFLR